MNAPPRTYESVTRSQKFLPSLSLNEHTYIGPIGVSSSEHSTATVSVIVQAATILDRFMYRAVLPLLVISAALLHVYTAYMAFRFATTTLHGLAAALAAWITPPIAQMVVAYVAWRTSGAVVNGYSFWLLAWIGLLLVFSLLVLANRLRRPCRMAITPQQDSVM